MNLARWSQLNPEQRSTVWTGVILGIGLMGAVDSIIFHQLLQWHNVYSDTSEFWRIFSDGLLQSFTAGMLFFGAIRLWSQRHRISNLIAGMPLWAGLALGAGAFQLFDGTVNHKILRLHQVREGVESNLPYDLAWNGFALTLLAVGWILLTKVAAEAPPTHDESGNTRAGINAGGGDQ